MSEYLRDYSKKDSVWDKHKRDALRLSEFLAGDDDFVKCAEKLRETAKSLCFKFVDDVETGESKLKLKSAWFSRWRHDPVSVWRRSLKWRARWFEALPRIFEAYPSHRWVFLTLTVKNCDISELNAQCKHLNASFRRMTRDKLLTKYFHRKEDLNAGYYKGLEVTRGKDGSAHPHLHVLLHMPDDYFKRGYLSQKVWADLWQKAAQLDYEPMIDIRAVKPKKGDAIGSDSMIDAVLEVTKYPTKAADLLQCPGWTKEFIKQMNRVRAIEVAGTLKNFVSDVEKEDDDLINVDENKLDDALEIEITQLFFEFDNRKKVRRYKKVDKHGNGDG